MTSCWKSEAQKLQHFSILLFFHLTQASASTTPDKIWDVGVCHVSTSTRQIFAMISDRGTSMEDPKLKKIAKIALFYPTLAEL